MGAEMIDTTIDRRALIAGGVALGMSSLLASPVAGSGVRPVMPETLILQVSSSRTTRAVVWKPANPVGIALVSTGHGSSPDRYGALAQSIALQGFVVYAPLHVDSLSHPDRAKFTREASFSERIADMNAAGSHAAKAHPGLPVIAVGHSFGTLTALCLAGGLGYAGTFRQPAVKAVLGFSTPGRIPGLVQPNAYAAIETPLMIVTGTADTVPGFVTDPADHLFAAETAPTPAYALVLDGGGHELVAGTDPRFQRALLPARDFLAAHGLGDAAARARLAKWKPAAGDRFIVRNAA